MKTRVKAAWAALGLSALALGLGVGRAQAANPAYLNIDVTINASLSVAVNNVQSSTYGVVTWNTATPNQEFTSGTQASSTTVTNDSNVVEKWYLSGSTVSINTASNPETWTLRSAAGAPGTDEYVMQAVFGSSNTAAGGCPVNGGGSWGAAYAPRLSGVPAQYTDTTFADSTLTNLGGLFAPDTGSGATSRMFASGKRVVCWRLLMPASTSTTDQQNLQLIVTAGP